MKRLSKTTLSRLIRTKDPPFGKNQLIVLKALTRITGEFTTTQMVAVAFPEHRDTGTFSTRAHVALRALVNYGILDSRLEPKPPIKTRCGVNITRSNKLIRKWCLNPDLVL